MDKVRERLYLAEKNFKTNIMNAWIIYFLIIIGAFIYFTTLTEFPQAFIISIIVAVAGFVPFMLLPMRLAIN